MSGGVDSSLAAALLLEQGHEVVGAYMKNWINEDKVIGDCPWQQDVEDARGVAEQLGIEFRVVNLMQEYKERVVEYLLKGYRAGITPNPDAMCNREMKFGVFLDYAKEQGFEKVATGHYCRLQDKGESKGILRGLDPSKDQSYFLALLEQHQVESALFPIGDMLKSEVREESRKRGLSTSEKKDSQGICFIGQVKMSDFLTHYVPDDPGPIMNAEGEKLGEHRGLHLYTLGQRKGIGVPSNTYGEAYVVVEKRAEDKALVVAFDSEQSPKLYASSCLVKNISWIAEAPACLPNESVRLEVQPRYRTPAVSGDYYAESLDTARFTFDAPQRALTPGQVCGFYQGEELLGGGFFETIEYS